MFDIFLKHSQSTATGKITPLQTSFFKCSLHATAAHHCILSLSNTPLLPPSLQNAASEVMQKQGN